jgi:hypothetical protein
MKKKNSRKRNAHRTTAYLSSEKNRKKQKKKMNIEEIELNYAVPPAVTSVH